MTNRTNLLCAMQIIEAASIIGLIRRTQALTGRVGVVAGVLGLFRRDAVQAVGGYRGEMATEDIDLSWRLLLAGWLTSYEPAALVGMQVPARLPGPVGAAAALGARTGRGAACPLPASAAPTPLGDVAAGPRSTRFARLDSLSDGVRRPAG